MALFTLRKLHVGLSKTTKTLYKNLPILEQHKFIIPSTGVASGLSLNYFYGKKKSKEVATPAEFTKHNLFPHQPIVKRYGGVSRHVGVTPTTPLSSGKDYYSIPQPRDNYPDNSRNSDLPSHEQLDIMVKELSHAIPRFFSERHSYEIYDPNLLFINRISEKTTTSSGVGAYAFQMGMLKTVGRLKHADVKMDIMKITKHPEDGCIKVRWRIHGISAFTAFGKIFQAKKSTVSELKDNTVWYDGFSTFYVNNKGKIQTHVVDNMVPVDNNYYRLNLVAKLATLLGLTPKQNHGSAAVFC